MSGSTHFVVAPGGVRLEVRSHGAGTLLVMIPSSARGVEDFEEIASRLAGRGFRVLLPQPRMAGASTGPVEALTLHHLAADIAAVIAHENAGPAFVVGHAFGNWVARMVAANHPEHVRGVVIAAAGSRDFPRRLVADLNTASDITAPQEARLAALRSAFFAAQNDPAPWLEGWYPAVAHYQKPIIADPREQEWWLAGSAPVLDLQALQDPFRPRGSAAAIRDALGGERVEIATIDGASHALFPEQPDAVANAMLAWLCAQNR